MEDLFFVILGLGFLGTAVLGIVLMVMSFLPRSSPPPKNTSASSSLSDRLEELDRLKQEGQISDGAYEEQRRRVLDEI